MKNTLLALLVPLLLCAPSAFAALAVNKKVVRDFYDLAFNQHQPKEAALKYLTEEYVQHNPYVATGRQAFIDAFAGEKPDGSKTDFKRLIAEDDLVVLHSHKASGRPGERGSAGIDIFRVKNGKISEHWDVNQAIPENPKNSMF